MAFRNLVQLVFVGLTIYLILWGTPEPLKEFFSSILEALKELCIKILAVTVRLCWASADYLEECGRNASKEWPSPPYPTRSVGHTHQAAKFGAYLLRGTGNYIVKFLGYNPDSPIVANIADFVVAFS